MFTHRVLASTIQAEQATFASLLRRGRHDLAAMDTQELLATKNSCLEMLADRDVPFGLRTKLAEDYDHILDLLDARQDLGDPLLN